MNAQLAKEELAEAQLKLEIVTLRNAYEAGPTPRPKSMFLPPPPLGWRQQVKRVASDDLLKENDVMMAYYALC